MIDLNKIDVKDKNPIFNNGKAGEVIATFKIVKKEDNDASRLPDWNVLFEDSQNRVLKEGFYYLDPSRYQSDEKFKNRLNYEAITLKHMVNAFYGKDFEFPAFSTPKEMLDGCMELLSKHNDKKVKIGVTFGTTKRPSKNGYLVLKTTFPFITTNLDEDINFSKIDLMERPQPSTPEQEDTSNYNTGGSEALPWDQ